MVEVKNNKLPVVFITPEAKAKLDLYIQLCPYEISGLGRVSRLGNDFLVEEIYLLDQEVTSASTELSAEAVARFLVNLVNVVGSGIDPTTIKLWWHSHATMSVFWSSTDESTAGKFSNGWMLSLVGNKSGEYLVRLDLFEPIRLTLDGLRFEVKQPEDPNLRAAIEKEVKSKVKVKTFTYDSYFNSERGWPYGQPFPKKEERRW